LEFLLAFDGRIHQIQKGYWLKFEIKRTAPTPERPHGLRYSFTLHDPNGNRLMGFDNAHGVAPRGARYRKALFALTMGIGCAALSTRIAGHDGGRREAG
jgi:hypothetical protein